jgi:thiol-disulfide isomerase/thioredoxin
MWRVAAIAGFALINLNLTTCRSNSSNESATTPAAPGDDSETPSSDRSVDFGKLGGVNASILTNAEQKRLGEHINELLAPCPDQPVSLVECITQERDCETCVPAANFLVGRVQRGDTRELVQSAFRARFSPDKVKSIDTADSPWKGTEDAPVTLVEWADFECPFCRMAAAELDNLMKRYHGKVKLVFKNYPLPAHTHAEAAARAVLAARNQGKFWKMHAALFDAAQTNFDKPALLEVAKRLELDVKQFEADMKSDEVTEALEKEKAQAQELGLRGTPMIYINGRKFDLEQFDLREDLGPWIDLELEAAGQKPVTGGAAPAPSASASAAPAPAPSAAAAQGTP